MAADPLAGCEEKLERAKAHLKTLEPLIDAFFAEEPEPYRIYTEIDEKTSRYLGRISINREPPLHLSVVVGDILHNLRCVLDHLMRQLVLANGCKPAYSNAFPLFDEEPPDDPCNGERQRWERYVKGIDDEALGFVKFCQPYNALDRNPAGHTLAGLRRLSNEDKHRTLIPGLCAVHTDPKFFKFQLVETINVKPPIEKLQVRAGRPLKDKDLVFHLAVEIIGPDPQVKAKGGVPLDVGFGKPPVPVKGLGQMSEAVEMILGECRRRFINV